MYFSLQFVSIAYIVYCKDICTFLRSSNVSLFFSLSIFAYKSVFFSVPGNLDKQNVVPSATVTSNFSDYFGVLYASRFQFQCTFFVLKRWISASFFLQYILNQIISGSALLAVCNSLILHLHYFQQLGSFYIHTTSFW